MRLLSPFPLEHAHALPVTGEHHPLRREFNRWMSLANSVTMILAFFAFVGILSLKREPVPPKSYLMVHT